jgi:hypothetical protein
MPSLAGPITAARCMRRLASGMALVSFCSLVRLDAGGNGLDRNLAAGDQLHTRSTHHGREREAVSLHAPRHSSSDADPMPVGMRNACLRRLAAEQTDRCRGLHCIVT